MTWQLARADDGGSQRVAGGLRERGGADLRCATAPELAARPALRADLGATAGRYDTPSSRSASLVDEYGVSLNGRAITFAVNGGAAGSASTNSSGIASTSWTPLLAAGTYGTNAAFAGDAPDNASAGAARSRSPARRRR